jgi:hypothetical protein
MSFLWVATGAWGTHRRPRGHPNGYPWVPCASWSLHHLPADLYRLRECPQREKQKKKSRGLTNTDWTHRVMWYNTRSRTMSAHSRPTCSSLARKRSTERWWNVLSECLCMTSMGKVRAVCVGRSNVNTTLNFLSKGVTYDVGGVAAVNWQLN